MPIEARLGEKTKGNSKGAVKVDTRRIRPSRWYYGLAALTFVVGCLLATLIFGFGVTNLVSSIDVVGSGLTQVVVPGTTTLTLSETGRYTVFYESRSVVNGAVYISGGLSPSLACTLTSNATGTEIPLEASITNSTYDIGGREGTSVWVFDIDQPGTYAFSCGYTDGRTEPEVVLAIGTGFVEGILGMVFGTLGSVFGGLGVLFGTTIIAVIIAIVVFVKRQQAKKRLEEGGFGM